MFAFNLRTLQAARKRRHNRECSLSEVTGQETQSPARTRSKQNLGSLCLFSNDDNYDKGTAIK